MAEEIVVELTSEQQTAAAAETARAAQLQTLNEEIARLKTSVGEKDEAVRYWHGQVKGAKPAAAAAATVDADEDDPDMLDLIGTKGGAKKLTEFLARKGFVSKKEVEEQVNARADTLVRESRTVERFPELRDTESDFFKATVTEYGSLLKQGIPQGVAMEQAARNVRLVELEAGGEGAPVKKGKPEDAIETERLRRVKVQSGDKGRRAAAASEEDTVDADTAAIWKAMGVSEKDGLAARKENAITRNR